jgi:hypothetical protein
LEFLKYCELFFAKFLNEYHEKMAQGEETDCDLRRSSGRIKTR